MNSIVTNSQSQYDKTDDCPSRSSGTPDISVPREEKYLAEVMTDSLNNILSGLVDGGSTEAMTNLVELSTPPEAMETTDELIEKSPFLSDSVLSAAITREMVLPNAMIRDILVENPQSAKSDALMNALDQRFVLMPDSMMAQIITGQTILGSKEEKELELAYRQQKTSIAAKKLKRIYDTDTTGTFGIDNLISMVSNEITLISYYDLVSFLSFVYRPIHIVRNGLEPSVAAPTIWWDTRFQKIIIMEFLSEVIKVLLLMLKLAGSLKPILTGMFFGRRNLETVIENGL